MTESYGATPLTPDRLADLSRFWRESFPLQPMNDAILAERVFGPPDYKPENTIARVDSRGLLAAVSVIVPPGLPDPKTGERVGGLRAFGVHPAHRKKGLGTELLAESSARLHSMGASSVDFLSTPPFYIRPGVDIRQTDVIAWLQRRGFEQTRTNFNMTVDLAQFRSPGEKTIFAADEKGYSIRRARRSDREAFGELCVKHWTANWRDEAWQGAHHVPVSLFLAMKPGSPKEEIVGFAAYETSQCLGSFGPTGVAPEHQGHGLGKRLLWATLADMQSLGRKVSEIGWIGPVDFYYRSAGAVLGPVFWGMRRRLAEK